MTTTINNPHGPTSNMIGSSGSAQPSGGVSPGRRPVDQQEAGSWFEAMAHAWGNALDQQAGRITELSDQISNSGGDQPSTMTLLTAESMKMQFMANNASTSSNSVGQSLETLGRKQ